MKFYIFVSILLLAANKSDSRINTYPKQILNWKLIGGDGAPDGSYPYQVSLRHQGYALKKLIKHNAITTRGSYHFGFHTCGGSIISSEYILTAAHCISYEKPETYLAVVGTNTLNEGGIAYAVTEIHWHKNFSIWHGQHDVAVLKVSPPITYTDYVKPVLIEDGEMKILDEVTLSGWGTVDRSDKVPNNMQHVKLHLIDVAYCNSKHQLTVTDNQVCTSTILGHGACKGDSGGPLVKIYPQDIIKQLGIVSYSRDCASGYPDVYTRVAKYLPWIREKCNNCI